MMSSEQTPKRILIVDDDPESLLLVQLMLKRGGYTVSTAASADEALDQVKSSPTQPDLILTDIRMPGQDGFEFATALTNFYQGLIAFITAVPSEEIQRQVGNNPLFIKPITPLDFLTAINDLFNPPTS